MSVVALVPYLVLQLKGLGIIVSEASYGRISATAAVWAGSLALIVYVVVSGVRGSAWTAALKDLMILGVAVGIGIYLPLHYFGGFGAMFRRIAEAKPGFLTLPRSGMSPAWLISTVLLSAVGGVPPGPTTPVSTTPIPATATPLVNLPPPGGTPVQFVSAVGARPGGTASVTVQTS